MTNIAGIGVIAALAWSAGPAWAAGDATAGHAVFQAKCSLCHAVAQGQNKVGPSLFGVVGRKAGTVADYTYSTANSTSGKTWDEPTLMAYLADPQAMVPGTKMTFGGLPDETTRQNLVAYLTTIK